MIFTKKTCGMCKTVFKEKPYILKYNTADGLQSMNICKMCAKSLNGIIDRYSKDD